MTAKIINLFAGPGTGKSTTAAALFAELKYRGVDCEYIQEYAKDVTWEKRGPKVFECQEYIFGKQHFRIQRTASEVDYIVTDCPIMMGCVYSPEERKLHALIKERHDSYDSLNIFLGRASFDAKAYNPNGRHQSAEEAIKLDVLIRQMLVTHKIPYFQLEFNRETPKNIISLISLLNEMDDGWKRKITGWKNNI